MSIAQKQLLQNLWPQYGVAAQQQPLDLTRLFPSAADCVLEIGFGMGQGLAQMAAADPQRNYIGIEVHRPGVASLLRQLQEWQLDNVRVICDDAVMVLRQMIPPSSLAAVQIYFPDPWPKRRHHKRRLIQPDFIQLLAGRLRPGALLHLATDWQDYAEHMLAVMTASQLFNNSVPQGYVERPGWRPLTKFERRGQQLGHEMFDLIFVRNATD